MKKLLFLLFLILINTASSFGQWSIPHKALVFSGTASGTAATLGWTTAAGNKEIVLLNIVSGGASVSSMVDNATGGSSTYTCPGAAHSSSTALFSDSYICWSDVKAGATTITITTSDGSATHRGYVFEVSGLATGAPESAGGTSNATGTSGSPFQGTGPSVTTTVSGDFVANFMAAATNQTTIATSGWTTDAANQDPGVGHVTSTSAAAATYQPVWGLNAASDAFVSSTAAFKPSSTAQNMPPVVY